MIRPDSNGKSELELTKAPKAVDPLVVILDAVTHPEISESCIIVSAEMPEKVCRDWAETE